MITLRATMGNIATEKKSSLKVLVIRFSALGDLILITPVLRVLKTQLNAEVHIITKEAFGSLLTPNPYVDRVWTIGTELSASIKKLKAEKFDHLVDLHKNLRSLRIRLALWHVPVTGYQKANWAKWLMVHFKIDRLPDNHVVDRYLKAVARLGALPDGRGLDIFLANDQEVNLSGLGLAVNGYTALVIGAAHFTKRMPPDKLQEVIARLPGKVVLIGGPAEMETGNRLAQSDPDRIINTCGRYDLQGSASLVHQAHSVIAHDTGFMHIAAALRKPVVAIFGGTLAEYGFWPYYGKEKVAWQRVEVEGLSCRPCSRFGRADCPRGHFKCMRNIPAGQVIQAWQQVL